MTGHHHSSPPQSPLGRSAATNAPLPRLLRLREVLNLTSLGRSTVWDRARRGTFPKPAKLGPRTTVWNAAEVEQWIAEALASRS